ncbi:hypothetical protein S7335_2391 [Synechococcus sp. PCC 7335]|nr:hypothetical protein S7335_2391 [Synechococcus sp. PCC 7335]
MHNICTSKLIKSKHWFELPKSVGKPVWKYSFWSFLFLRCV